MANESHAHRDVMAHQVDVDDSSSDKTNPLSDVDGAECGHLCHGHNASMVGGLAQSVDMQSENYRPFNISPPQNFSQAPPTPPPNA